MRHDQWHRAVFHRIDQHPDRAFADRPNELDRLDRAFVQRAGLASRACVQHLRSELVALDVEDIEECPEDLRVRIRRSKTDQDGQGAVVAECRGSIACPVTAVLDYVKAAGITSGPVFRRIPRGNHITDHRLGAQTICKLVKDQAAKLGLDPKQYGDPQHARGFSDLRCGEGRQSLQDDGCQPPQERGHEGYRT
jgi:hypothetical protein